MTAKASKQRARLASMKNDAMNAVSKYNNDQLNADLMNYLNNYGDFGNYWKSHFHTEGFGQNNVNKFIDKQKQSLQNYIDTNFGDIGGSNSWLDSKYSSDFGQNSVNNLLDTQYNAALDQIDRAKNRGLLSDTGYQSALNNLGTQYNSGYANVNAVNQGIIDDYKNALTEKAQGFMTDLSNYDLGKYSTINTSNWDKSFNDLYNTQQNNYQSDFDNATQGMNLFDTSDIINTARTEQGVNNAQTDELMNAIDETSRQKQKKAGLGNTGVF